MSGNWIGTPEYLKEHNLTKEVVDAYLESLYLHIDCVREAGKQLGVPEKQLDIHDASKFWAAEFPGYARHFKGGGDPDGFAKAWLHHLHHNPHHWQHWIFPDGLTPAGSKVVDGCLPMPACYATEMVADWMGAGRAYTGSWDMTSWLEANLGKVKLHPETKSFVGSILVDLGYKKVVSDVWAI